jgi:hypothetical protein
MSSRGATMKYRTALDEGGGVIVVFEEDRVEHHRTGPHQEAGPSMPQPFVDDVREGT